MLTTTILNTALGFLSSSFSPLLKYFQDKQDKKHELALLDKQIEMQKEFHTQKLEMVNVDADIRAYEAAQENAGVLSGVKFIDGLNASVRPVITYFFFAVFLAIQIAIMLKFIENSVPVEALWTERIATLFDWIIGFWFGHRSYKK